MSHFKVGQGVKCKASGMTGKVIEVDPKEKGKYYKVQRTDGSMQQYSPDELTALKESWDDERMDIIGQNGNDGLHYDLDEAKLDELGPSTLSRYARAAGRDISHQAIKGNHNKINKRVKGIDNASHKLAMKAIRKENQEKEEEVKEAGVPFKKPYNRIKKRTNSDGSKTSGFSIAKQLAKRAIAQAAKKNRLTKEEVEEIERSYMEAAEAYEAELQLNEGNEPEMKMANSQVEFIEYAAEEISEWLESNDDIPEWFQNKLTKAFTVIEGLHSYVEGEEGAEEDDDEEVDEGYVSHAQRKAVWATRRDGGKGHPDNKKKKNESVEIDEDHLTEATFKIDVEGLPAFFIDGQGAGAIKQGLRKIVKKPDMIKGIERVQPADVKKHFRLKAQGKDVEGSDSVDGVSESTYEKIRGNKNKDDDTLKPEGKVNELSTKTLRNYRAKASRDQAGGNPLTRDPKRFDKRSKGISRANKKLANDNPFELYDKPGWEKVSNELKAAVKSKNKSKIQQLQRKYAEYGARDTEANQAIRQMMGEQMTIRIIPKKGDKEAEEAFEYLYKKNGNEVAGYGVVGKGKNAYIEIQVPTTKVLQADKIMHGKKFGGYEVRVKGNRDLNKYE